MQFHMKFENFENLKNKNIINPKNEVFDYNFFEYYSSNFNIENKRNGVPVPQANRESFSSRFKNSLNYFVPYKNFKSYLKAKILKRKSKYYLFSNTLYQ